MRVGEFAEGLEEFASLVNTLAGVTFAELFAADRSTQKLEIAIANDFKVRREGRDIDRRRGPSHEDELALVLEVGCACAELEANIITTAPQAFDSVADGRGLAG